MSEHPTVGDTSIDSCKALIARHVRAAAEQPAGTDLGAAPAVADSIVFAEVIASIEDETGIEVPMDDKTARALRSMDSFAALIHELLVTKAGGDGVG